MHCTPCFIRELGRGRLLLVVLSSFWALSGVAATFEWAAPADGLFNQGSNWSPIGIPDADDIARFSVSSGPTYEVALGISPTIDKLIVDGGTPELVGTPGQRTLTITDDGDVTDEDILVIGGGRLDILSQIDVVAGDGILSVGNDGDGLLTVDGTTASLTVDGTSRGHFIGGRGALGQLVVSNDATASFGYNAGSEGTLEVGVSNFNATQGFVNVLGGGTLNAGHLNIATSNTDATGFVTLQDAGSTIDVLADLTIGSATGGAGTLDVLANGTLDTRIGSTTTINATGTINVNGGDLNINGNTTVRGTLDVSGGSASLLGDVLIDGGTWSQTAGTIRRVVGGTTTVSNDGLIDWATVGMNVADGQTLLVNSGGDAVVPRFDVAGFSLINAGGGTLVVDGTGSTVTVSGDSEWGNETQDATIEFKNAAVGTFADVELARFGSAGITGRLRIESGAQVAMEDFEVASFGQNQNSAEVTITGTGSELNLTGGFTGLRLGRTAGGTGTITIDSNGTLDAGTQDTTIRQTGTLDINGGVFTTTGDFDLEAGAVNLDDGTLAQNGAATVTVGIGGPAVVSMLNGSRLTTGTGGLQVGAGGEIDVVGVSGDPTLVFARGPVTIDGGTLTVGDFGEFTMLGDDLTLVARNHAQVDFGFDQAIHSGRTYSVESGADVTVGSLLVGGFSSGDGTLNVDGDETTLTATSTTFIAQSPATGRLAFTNAAVGDLLSVRIADAFSNSDGLWSLSGGSQATTNSIDIATSGADAVGRLSISGAGTLLEQRPGANLEIGNDTAGTATVTVQTGATLVTGTPTFPTNGITTINATGRLDLDGGNLFAATIDHTHGGVFDFFQGRLSVETFQGDLLNQGGTLAPGASAGSTTIVGDYTQQTNATLEIEIGGTAAVTEHDFVSVSGGVLLDGLLDLSLINGYLPDPGDTFTVLAAGNLTGFFDNATPGSRLDTSDGLGSFLVDIDSGLDQIVLRNFIASLLGDYNDSGQVEQGDLDLVLQNWGVNTDVAGVPAGWIGNPPDGVIDQGELDGVLLNWGSTPAPDFRGVSLPGASVPEPAGLLALGISAAAWGRSARRRPA